MTYIAGHKLTNHQRKILDVILDYLRKHGDDSHLGPHTSPKGDGRWIPVTLIVPHGISVIAELSHLLAACEVAYHHGCVKAVPI